MCVSEGYPPIFVLSDFFVVFFFFLTLGMYTYSPGIMVE